MNRHPLADFIRSHLPVAAPAVAALVEPFEPRALKKHEFFLRQGEVSGAYLFLTKGLLRAFTLDADGHEVTTCFYSPIRVVFEAASFFLRTVSVESIQAVTDCEGYAITYPQLNQLFHAVPEGREFGRKMLVKEFVAFKQRAFSLINQTAEQRYAELLENDKAVLQHAQLKHVASYLGITDTSLSRIRRDYAKKPRQPDRRAAKAG